MKRIAILLVTLGMVFSTATPAFTAGDPTLTKEETASLVYMFKEEKLARDVYNAMYTLWENKIFLKIATREQVHMDAIQVLLERYGVTVPPDVEGVFTDPQFTQRYEELISASTDTLVDSLNVGVTIEETEIADLGAYLGDDNITRNDIKQVYSNLLRASNKHLSSFIILLSKIDAEGDELILLGVALFDGNGKGDGYKKSFEMKVQSQNQTQNQYQNQTQIQNQDQVQTQTQAGNGNGTGECTCNCDCGCDDTCGGNGAQNGKP